MLVKELLIAGLVALKDYIALHVITCLVPAFLLAGGMVSFINRDAILDYLGEQANKLRSFSLASASSFFLAACSCTVIPVASGLYYSGAGIGAAFIVLWVAPAANILALIYTGSILGGAMVASRIVGALVMAFIVGYVMSAAFRERNPGAEVTPVVQAQERGAILAKNHAVLLLLVLISLLAPNYLGRSGPYTQKLVIWAVTTAIMIAYALVAVPKDQLRDWLRETWWFVKLIFPLLLLGVFIVGIIGRLLPEAWIREWLGGNGLLANFLATLIGAVSYFATMTEAPFVDTLMKLGMGKGPALALLLTGPGISLPNWLAVARVFGARKAVVYVITISVLGTLVGWFFGNFVLS